MTSKIEELEKEIMKDKDLQHYVAMSWARASVGIAIKLTRQKTLAEVEKMINEWAFTTMKNFSGKDKDFFKSDVQELKSELEQIKT